MKPRKMSRWVQLDVAADGQPLCPCCKRPLVKVGQEDDSTVYACPDFAPVYAEMMRRLGERLAQPAIPSPFNLEPTS